MSRSGSWLRRIKRLAIYTRDDFRCVYCGKQPEERHLTVDHLVPEARGGNNRDHNLVTACRWCNSAKGDRTLPEFVSDPERVAEIRKQAKRRLTRLMAQLRFEQRVEDEVHRRLVEELGVEVPF